MTHITIFKRTLISLFVLLAVSVSFTFAQVQTARMHEPEPLIQKIQQDYQNGKLSLDQAMLNQFYAVLQPEKLAPQYHGFSRHIIKCFTPVVMEYEQNRSRLSQNTTSAIDGLLNDQVQANIRTDTLYSDSGKFMLIYDENGQDSVPKADLDGSGYPDYVEWAAHYADSTWNEEVDRLGFKNPIVGPDHPYKITFANNDYYGTTYPTGDGSTRMELNSSFDGFPDNTDPDGRVKGSLKVTIAHEFKHAISYAINRWNGESDRWAEMDATLMEDVVFDNVNDYYNYNQDSGSIFYKHAQTVYPGTYSDVVLALYYKQTQQMDFWVNTWDYIAADENTRLLDAMDSVLTKRGEHFPEEYTRSHLYLFATGPDRMAPDYGFEERDAQFDQSYAYPASALNYFITAKEDTLNNKYSMDINGVPPTTSQSLALDSLSAHYYDIKPNSSDNGNIEVVVYMNHANVGLGLLAYHNDGTQEYIEATSGQDSLYANPGWQWQNISQLGVVVANPVQDTTRLHYQLKFGTASHPIVVANQKERANELPSNITLNQNYPNPFNPSTQIRFSLPEAQNVRLIIYDLTGRRIETLVRQKMNSGFHTVTFDGESLASGIYLYRLITPERTLTRKMILLK